MKQNSKDNATCGGGASMKRIRFLGAGVLLLLLGITPPIYANQQEDQDKQQQEKDKQQQEKDKKHSKTRISNDTRRPSNSSRSRTDSSNSALSNSSRIRT